MQVRAWGWNGVYQTRIEDSRQDKYFLTIKQAIKHNSTYSRVSSDIVSLHWQLMTSISRNNFGQIFHDFELPRYCQKIFHLPFKIQSSPSLLIIASPWSSTTVSVQLCEEMPCVPCDFWCLVSLWWQSASWDRFCTQGSVLCDSKKGTGLGNQS